MRTLLALIVLSSAAHAQVARWTPFERIDDIPKDRWGSSYGFVMEGPEPVVTKRYAYPLPKPSLWAGDKLVSVKGKPVTSSSEALAAIDSIEQRTIPIKVERTYANGTKRTISVTLERSIVAVMERAHHATEINWPLPNVDQDSFGVFEGVVEWVGQTTDPVTKKQVDCYKMPSGIKVSRALKPVVSKIGVFMFRDGRPRDGREDIALAEFPRDQWKPGQDVRISRCYVWVEPEEELELNGKTVKVTVLTMFHPDYPSQYQPSP